MTGSVRQRLGAVAAVVLVAPACAATTSRGQQQPAPTTTIAGVTSAAHPASTPAPMLAVARINCKPCWVGIGLLSPKGGKVLMLTRHAGWEDDEPSWSPDRTRIAFKRTTDGERTYHIYVMRSDARGTHQISYGRFDQHPAWSPNGRWIAYSSSSGIRLIRPDGTAGHTVPGTRQAGDPAWSPDGRRLAFSQNRFVWTARVDGGGRRRLVPGREPAWSPNGRLIAFTPSDGGVATVPAGGGRSHFLSPGMQPAWSPNGAQIAFTRWPPSLEFSVWVMNANGTGRHMVLRNARAAAWRP